MADEINRNQGQHKVIVGLGETGYSVAKYFAARGIAFEVVDDNPAPARLRELKKLMPDVQIKALELDNLLDAGEIVLSPGVPRALSSISTAVAQGVGLTSDVKMFGELAHADIVGITGSNGKSTVTSIVGVLAEKQLTHVAVAGNIGTPCLDVLAEDVQLYIVELSSFQLEVATEMPLKVACLLNLSPDHLDRYDSQDSYFHAKQNIFNDCQVAIFNRDEMQLALKVKSITFGAGTPDNDSDFGLVEERGETYLLQGTTRLLKAGDLKLKGRHNIINVLAALAIGATAGLDMSRMVRDLPDVEGLAHRCEWVGDLKGVSFINDSKATNVGACLAAITGFGSGKNLVLVLGGEGKGADFSRLVDAIDQHVRKVILFGRDQQVIRSALADSGVSIEYGDSLESVVDAAIAAAEHGDTVLFSPACASYDMFDNFVARGNAFKRLVTERLS